MLYKAVQYGVSGCLLSFIVSSNEVFGTNWMGTTAAHSFQFDEKNALSLVKADMKDWTKDEVMEIIKVAVDGEDFISDKYRGARMSLGYKVDGGSFAFFGMTSHQVPEGMAWTKQPR